MWPRWSLGLPLRGVTLQGDRTAVTTPPPADELVVYDARFPLPADVQPAQVVRVHEGGHDHDVYLRVPTKAEEALMALTGHLAEGFPFLPPALKDWPATLLAELREPLDAPYCLTAFPEPLSPDEALVHCYGQAQALYARYQPLIQDLAQTLGEVRTMTSIAIREYCRNWQEWADDTDEDDA